MSQSETRAAARRAPLLWLLVPVPALALGVIVMRASGVPAAVWGQNVAAWVAGALVCLGMWATRRSAPRPTWADAAAVLAVGALAATLLAPGVQGVHRWVALGPVRLHAAAVLLPLLLVALEDLARRRGWWAAMALAAGVGVILFLQPDAAQATAWGLAAALLLLSGAGRDPLRRACVFALPLLAGATWLRRDPLGRVPHVEDVVGLAARLGTGWAVAAVASLLLLPIPFLLAARGTGRRAGAALATYVAVTLVAPFVGSFPVPVLGYGMSPILGYLLVLGVLPRSAALHGMGRSLDR